MNEIKEHDRIVLTVDVPAEKLAAGDVGVVIHIHSKGQAFEVEFIALDGKTLTIVTLERSQVRPVDQGEIAHARRVA